MNNYITPSGYLYDQDFRGEGAHIVYQGHTLVKQYGGWTVYPGMPEQCDNMHTSIRSIGAARTFQGAKSIVDGRIKRGDTFTMKASV
jgi:hypothetical protein